MSEHSTLHGGVSHTLREKQKVRKVRLHRVADFGPALVRGRQLGPEGGEGGREGGREGGGKEGRREGSEGGEGKRKENW